MKEKISIHDINANIKDIEIVKHVTKAGKILRWAVITTESGYAVTGRPSATINQANDNVEVGEDVAINNAMGEMWPLMGYHLSVKNYENRPLEKSVAPLVELMEAVADSGVEFKHCGNEKESCVNIIPLK